MTEDKYHQKIDEYNQNPHICLQCGKPILCGYEDILSNIKQKKFCNSSCAASYNNKGKIKNKTGKNGRSSHSYLDNLTDEQILESYNLSTTLKEFSQNLGYKKTIDKNQQCFQNRFNKIGIDLEKFKSKIIIKQRCCRICEGKISKKSKTGLCQSCYIKEKSNQKIINWLNTGETGCKIGSNLRNCIRDYIYEKQDCKCAICNNINSWNGKELKFVLDHIDGDASNNKEDNLRLICPNCDSQLDTFKSKNKNSARNFRHKYYEQYNNIA